jgi:hypothetical protein
VSETTAGYTAEPAGFTMVQNRSVARHDLSMHALALLVKLLRRRNGGTHLCCPSYEVLRKDCEHAGKMPSPRSIADWLRELALARELAWVHTGRHSTYYFPGDAEFEAASDALLIALTATTTVATTTTATVVIGETATATVEQHYHYGSGTATATVVKQEVLNKTKSTRHSAPTERTAPPSKPAAKTAVRTPKQPAPTVEATPAEREHVPRKRAGGKAPAITGEEAPRGPTPIQRVEQGIKAAGVRVAMNWGVDGKSLAALLSGSDVTVEDVIGCFVDITTHKYGDEFMRKGLTVTLVCTRYVGPWLNWKENGEKGENHPGVGGLGGAARARPSNPGRPTNPQHAAHAASLDW